MWGGAVQPAGHTIEHVADVAYKRAVHRRAGADERMIARQFGAEVDAFLPVGLAGCQLASDGEVAAPGASAAIHANLHLRAEVLREELTGELLEPGNEPCVHAVADHV